MSIYVDATAYSVIYTYQSEEKVYHMKGEREREEMKRAQEKEMK